MLKEYKNELECDLAETYHIYDYRELPPKRVALFSVGLRENSRTKMKIANSKVPLETLLSAQIADALRHLVWLKTKDGQKNRNRPTSLFEMLIGHDDKTDKVVSFSSAEEFENIRKELIGKEV